MPPAWTPIKLAPDEALRVLFVFAEARGSHPRERAQPGPQSAPTPSAADRRTEQRAARALRRAHLGTGRAGSGIHRLPPGGGGEAGGGRQRARRHGQDRAHRRSAGAVGVALRVGAALSGQAEPARVRGAGCGVPRPRLDQRARHRPAGPRCPGGLVRRAVRRARRLRAGDHPGAPGPRASRAVARSRRPSRASPTCSPTPPSLRWRSGSASAR
ncbi:hypothetical protein CAP2UW1_1697 [Candidatus Accumulibacter phosphatis]|uniref:Uncharacterized protein n=1 Tax=Accumulibacter regalis TaxID=522306 RepID=C7RUF5_ACCRE